MSQSQPTTATPSASRAGMPLWAQRALTGAAVLALIFLLAAIAQQIAATRPASAPARVVSVAAGPYPLMVRLSHYPANAGYALPFAIAPAHPIHGTLTYTVSAIPDDSVDATPVNAGLTRDPKVANGVTGTVEITVRGQWYLHVIVDGPAGQGAADVPVAAQAAGVIPGWLAWAIGFVPVIGIALFFAQRRAAGRQSPGESR
jgi:hypothetical protein